MLKSHDLHPKISAKVVLLELSRVYIITRGARRTLSEVPERSGRLADTLGLNLYAKIMRN